MKWDWTVKNIKLIYCCLFRRFPATTLPLMADLHLIAFCHFSVFTAHSLWKRSIKVTRKNDVRWSMCGFGTKFSYTLRVALSSSKECSCRERLATLNASIVWQCFMLFTLKQESLSSRSSAIEPRILLYFFRLNEHQMEEQSSRERDLGSVINHSNYLMGALSSCLRLQLAAKAPVGDEIFLSLTY